MAYEGFQLLTYDYDEINTPQKNLPGAVLSAIVVVIIVYILIALGTSMLIGADQIVQHEEVALLFLSLLILIAVFGRPMRLRYEKRECQHN